MIPVVMSFTTVKTFTLPLPFIFVSIAENRHFQQFFSYIMATSFSGGRSLPSQQQDFDPTLVHGWHGWSNVAVGMPTFAPRWANVSNPSVGLIWLAQCWHDVRFLMVKCVAD
jgi:hypothetical protein